MNSFEELEAWKAARDIRLSVSNVVKKFPDTEKYRLKDQLIRSSRSVPANIAEGFGRFHYKENAQFCRQARGSLMETLEHILCAVDEDLMAEQEAKKIRVKIFHCLKVLNGYIAYLNRAKKLNNPVTK